MTPSSPRPNPDDSQPNPNLLGAWHDGWFHYWVRSHPHHTDYAGIVWHGTYVEWLEAARVEALRSRGVNFADFVATGYDLPVIDFSIRYRRGILMGEQILVRTQLLAMSKARLPWTYELWSGDRQTLHATATVALVCVDRDTNKIVRRLPASLEAILRSCQG